MRRSIKVAASAGVIAVLVLLTVGWKTSFAAWTPGGVPVCADTSHQNLPKVVQDGSGGAFIAWNDWRNSNLAVYVQRITSSGAIASGWPAGGVPVSSTTADHSLSDLMADGSGGVYVLWSYTDPTLLDTDIYLQRITASGTVASGWPAVGHAVVAAIDDQYAASMIPDGAGGVIVAWGDSRDGVYEEVYIQKVNSSGVDQWTPVGGKAVSNQATVWTSVRLASDGLGGAYVGWDDMVLGGYIQRIGSGGSPAAGWPAGGTSFGMPSGIERYIYLAPDGTGGVIFSWVNAPPASDGDIYALRLNSSGGVSTGWASLGELMCYEPTADQDVSGLISDGGGGAILVWEDQRNGNRDVYAQRVSAVGDTLWGMSGLPLSSTTDEQVSPQVTEDGAGGAFFTWRDGGALPNPTIFVQHVVADGRRALPVGGIGIGDDAYSQGWPHIAFVATHGAIVTFGNPQNLNPFSFDIYAQYVDGLGNFNAGISYPGWTSPIVPRNQTVPAQPVAQITPVLDGNQLTTYLNWSFLPEGPATLPASHGPLWLDEEEWITTISWTQTLPFIYMFLFDYGPMNIRGGRHTITANIDPDDLVPELYEDDNVWSGQWVWSPLVLIENSPVLRDPPPNSGSFIHPNTDGMMFDRHPDFAWVVAMASLHPDDDFDLWVYDDYTGSTAGFSNALEFSGFVSNSTDFVVGAYYGTPLNLYPAVERYDLGAGQPFLADQTDAAGRNGGEDESYLNQNLPPQRLANVYEAFLYAGTTYYFSLYRVLGLSDLAFEIFPPDSGGVWARGSGLGGGSMEINANHDTLAVTPSSTGWHPIVVYRSTGTNALDSDMTYHLTWSRSVIVDVPGDTPPSYTLAFHGPQPNPMTEKTRLHFTLANEGRAQLTIYDLRGRQVVSLLDETLGPGPHYAEWDGRANSGARVGAGIYWARLHAGGTSFVKRIAMLR